MSKNKEHSFALLEKLNFPFIKKEITRMAKMSSVNKNNKRIKLSDKFYKKKNLKKLLWIKTSFEERLKPSKNYQNYQETQLRIEWW